MSRIKKVILFGFTGVFCLLLGGCNQPKEEVNAPDMSLYSYYDNMVEKKVWVESEDLNNPVGMTWVKDSLYVVSKGGHCVLKYSEKGELEKTIGEIGNGDGEFRNPVAITHYEEEIYVLEDSNGKIQVFDLDGNFKKRYLVEDLNCVTISALDIEVDEKRIYISVAGGEKEGLRVYLIEKSTGEIQKMGKECMGYLGKSKENEIYYAQAYEFIEGKDYTGYGVGDCYVSMISKGRIDKLFQLADGYLPSDIVVYDDILYVFSKAMTQVDLFDSQGTYLKTVFSEQSSVQNRGMGSMAIDTEGNIFLSDEEDNVIYVLEMKD